MSKAFALAGARIGYALAVAGGDRRPPARPPPLPPVGAHAGGRRSPRSHHATEAMAILDAIRDERDRILAALRAMPDVTVYPVRRELRPVRAAEARRRGVAGAAGPRRAHPRPLVRRPERAPRHRRHRRTRSTCSCPHSRRYSPHERDRTHRHGDAHHEGDRRPRGARRWTAPGPRPPTPGCRSSITCSSSSARTPGGICTVTCEGRPGGRRPPHRGGRGHRGRAGAGGGARRQGGHPAVRVHHRAARRGRGRGRARSLGTRVRRPRGRDPRGDDRHVRHRAWSRTSCARSRPPPQMSIHVRLQSGRSPHHVVEAEFKAMAKALGDACSLTGRGTTPSTKGTL